jgi:hypothetical protein
MLRGVLANRGKKNSWSLTTRVREPPEAEGTRRDEKGRRK